MAEGQGEIQLLARRIQEIVEGDLDASISRSVTGSHIGASSVGSSNGHEELRRSVREAFSSGGSYH